MIEIIGGVLYQWDTGRSVEVTNTNASHVHFANPGDTKAVIMELSGSTVKIPDYLFHTGKQLCVYAVVNGVTVEKKIFSVTKRERPEHYVYEDDQRNYILELISTAEVSAAEAVAIVEDLRGALDRGEFVGPKGDTGEAGPQGPAGVDGITPAFSIGTVTTLDAGSNAFATITGSKENPVLNLGIPKGADGAGGGGSGGTGADGEDGGYYIPALDSSGNLSWKPTKGDMPSVQTVNIKGPKGDPGRTPARGTDYWTEADKQEIAEAAAGLVKVPEATMKPLTFTGAVNATYDGSEAVSVEIPEGGGGSGGETEWRLISKVTLSEDASSIEITKDSNENPFELSEFAYTIVGKSLGTSGNIGVKINGALIYYGTNLSNTNTTAELKSGGHGAFASGWVITYKEMFNAPFSSPGITSVTNATVGKMKSFWYGCTNGEAGVGFQAGTTLELWGR